MTMANSRMTAYERREQLISVGRKLFAERDVETLSVEEIASAAKVSKPIIYEHFGGKEGLYAVVVDRELQTLSEALNDFFAHPPMGERHTMERGVMAFLTYVEEHNEGFHVLLRDSPSTDPTGSLNTLLMTVSVRVEKMLEESFKRAKLPTKGAPYYAHMIVGLTVFSAEMWADNTRISKEELAAYIVNMAWFGMRGIDAHPQLKYEGKAAAARREKASHEAAKQLERERKRLIKEARSQGKSDEEIDKLIAQQAQHFKGTHGDAFHDGGDTDDTFHDDNTAVSASKGSSEIRGTDADSEEAADSTSGLSQDAETTGDASAYDVLDDAIDPEVAEAFKNLE